MGLHLTGASAPVVETHFDSDSCHLFVVRCCDCSGVDQGEGKHSATSVFWDEVTDCVTQAFSVEAGLGCETAASSGPGETPLQTASS